ncbi:unnamed protein product [Diplocarpon coronariae]
MERALPGLRSPWMATERKMWSKMLITFSVLLVATIMGILSIYWKADHSLRFNLPVFTVGPYLQQMAAAERTMIPQKTLGYVSEPGARHALKQEDFWFGIVVQANATTAMNYAYADGNAAYDPTRSIHLVYEGGRNSLTIMQLGYPKVFSFMNDFVLKFAKQKQESFRAANVGNTAALARQAETPLPISFAASTEIGTIHLIIISFLSVLMFGVLNEAMMGKVSMVRYYIYRMTTLPTLYLFVSLLYLALSCAWKIDSGKFFGASGYVIYWMLSWVAMMAFGLAIEDVHNVPGQPFTPVFLVFRLISNVATGFSPVELPSSFYRWGLAWPLRHDLIGAKTIIHGTKNWLRLNSGVLISWVAASLTLQPLTIWPQLRKNRKQAGAHKREVPERMYSRVPREEVF